jgi:transposase
MWERDSPEELTHNIILLARQGMSRRAIARALGVGRNTVRKRLTEHAAHRSSPHRAVAPKPVRAPRPSKLDPYRENVEKLLERFPDITAQRVLEQLRDQGFTGGYTAVKKLVRRLRPKPKPKISLPTPIYGPGEMSECDWASYHVEFTHAPPQRLNAFGYVLNYSRRKHFGFYKTCDLFALMDGHVETFTRFEGVAHRTKYDSQKPVVLRWEGRQPLYNPRFIDFATYYEFRPVACRPGHPNDKPLVERSFWELERSFFNGREFRDFEDLKAQLQQWMTTVSDVRRNPRTRNTPLERFVEEKPALRPLPAHDYDTARVVYRVCDIMGFIAWEANRYSLPYEHVTDILPVRITQTELFVYAADLCLIARHELQPKGAGETVTLPGHRPSRHRPAAELDQLRKAFQELGPQAEGFLRGLEQKHRSAAHHARHILALRQRYDTSDVLEALSHAQAFGAFNHDAIERILVARAEPRRLDEYVAKATAEKLERVVGLSTTQPRSLSDYDALPCWPASRKGAEPCPDENHPQIALEPRRSKDCDNISDDSD